MLTKAVVRVKIYVEYFSTKTKDDESMKKCLALILVFATVIMTLVACVQDNGEEQGTDPENGSQEETYPDNLPLVEKDADEAYTWVLDTQRLSDAVDKLLTLCYESGGTYLCKENENNTAQPGIREMFAEGRAATTTLRLLAVELDEIRNMQDEYGIVPMPKFDTVQTDYYTQMHDQFTVFAIPVSVASDKLELIGATMEAMASESLRTVKPAYYEIALKRKYMSDPVAWDMLDLTFARVIVDAGVVYGEAMSYPHHKLRTIIQGKKNSVASQYGKAASKMNIQLQKLVKKLENLE